MKGDVLDCVGFLHRDRFISALNPRRGRPATMQLGSLLCTASQTADPFAS